MFKNIIIKLFALKKTLWREVGCSVIYVVMLPLALIGFVPVVVIEFFTFDDAEEFMNVDRS